MKKKFWGASTLFLSVILALSGCSGGDAASSEGKNNAENGSAVDELTVVMPMVGTQPADFELIEKEISKIAEEKIKAKVKFRPVSIADWQQQTNLMFASHEKMDLVFVSGNTYSNMVAKGQLVPLNELIEKEGKGIVPALGEDYINAVKIKGESYAVPTIRDLATTYGLTMRKDLVDKYQIDIKSIKTLDDAGNMLKTIKQGEKNLSPLIPGGINRSFRDDYVWYDELSDGIGVLPNYDNDLKIVDLFETPEYADFIKTIRGWYKDGLILSDASTNKTSTFDLIKSGKGYAYFARQKPGFAENEKKASGVDLTVAELEAPVATTGTVTSAMWGIPINSELPDKAMAFLNMMFTDKEVINLFDWGIEGKHYVKVEGSDHVIDYPKGVDASNTGYNMPLGWMFGNQFLSYVMKGDDPDIWVKTDEFNKKAKHSKALGFVFDTSPVKTEYAAVSNVITQYKLPLETGSVDPDKILPEFIAKLKSSGIDKIIAEKQKQLDEWAKEKGVE
ncbi:ABC transporter substrate-binding protein [Paenibacillus donghaensis]|uniref:ABC transporter substrate-binding protein n=1 Tax=Paenibacillus donghaensis TaxID=414771 RepID=UPI0018833BCC|nr:ABC transporter substrate-binding protein [Paenibacillus donghaensis]MBE9916145.1 ABC transporter substrate-binding protein [Paenibacillus donghaensis]